MQKNWFVKSLRFIFSEVGKNRLVIQFESNFSTLPLRFVVSRIGCCSFAAFVHSSFRFTSEYGVNLFSTGLRVKIARVNSFDESF